tara:strand:+ start:582 stop:788 length:207 start_codon:yes stop_codon:yes gene_type:complete
MNKIINEAHKLYLSLEIGLFFDTYHDIMVELVDELECLEDDEIEDAKKILAKCRAIIKAQKILLTHKL